MVTFLSSAQSVYFSQYFCFMCIYQIFLIQDHTKSYVEKNTIRGHQCGAHGRQVAHKDQAGCPQTQTQPNGMATKFLAFFVLRFERCCPKQTTVARRKSKYLAQNKFSCWLHHCLRACSKNNISMISVFTLRSILIVNTKIIKGKLSNIFISEACIKLIALCINRHVEALRFKKVGNPCCRC